MNKTAGAAAARAIEALTGGALGAGAGALGGRATYKSPVPVEWQDEFGQVYSRPHTDEEKKERNKRTLRSAALGAVAGAGGGLGVSGARQLLQASAERLKLSKITDDNLAPLKHEVEVRQRQLQNAVGVSSTKFQQKRLEDAKRVLAEEEGAIKGLLRTARQERAKHPFGGITWGRRPKEAKTGTGESTTTDWHERTTHRGLVHRRYDDLAKGYGFKGFNLDTRPKVLSRHLLEKQSSVCVQAFLREASQILGA